MSLPGLFPKTTLPFASEDFLKKVTKNVIKLPDVAPSIPPREIMILDNSKTSTSGSLPGIGYINKLPSTKVPTQPIGAQVVPTYPIKTGSGDDVDNNLLYILLGITVLGYLVS